LPCLSWHCVALHGLIRSLFVGDLPVFFSFFWLLVHFGRPTNAQCEAYTRVLQGHVSGLCFRVRFFLYFRVPLRPASPFVARRLGERCWSVQSFAEL
jgi:hypothetical protein